MKNVVIIAGTDTDIGKTYVTAQLAAAVIRAGKTPAVCKPLQTGTAEGNSDPDWIARHLPELKRLAPMDEIPFSFAFPASPDYAARLESRKVDAAMVADRVLSVAERTDCDWFIVELAGGLLVPLNETETNLDLIRALNMPVILVTHPALGTVNHTLLSVNALKAAGISVPGIVMNRFPVNGNLLAQDNLEAIERFSGLPILAVVSESDTFSLFTDFSALGI